MSQGHSGAVWDLPKSDGYPKCPEVMSFSLLNEIEECPRRWALSSATYSSVWGGRGYPRPMHAAQIEGIALHAAIEKLTKAFLAEGSAAISDPSAMVVMRKLGGLTAVLQETFEQTISAFHENPRAAPFLEAARKSIGMRVQAARPKLQSLLSRMKLQPRAERVGLSGKVANPRAPGLGSHAEIVVEAIELAWKGILDLLTISEDACEIRDFKTGVRNDKHKSQLALYALLWSKDAARNPRKIPATRLVVSYPDGDVVLPGPNSSELEAVQADVVERTRKARAACATSPPVALPALDRCPGCFVRHMCSEYWEFSTTEALPEASTSGDVQLRIMRRHAIASWDAVLERNGKPTNVQILLRTPDTRISFSEGQRARLLNVFLAAGDEETPNSIVVTMSSITEVYLLP